MFMLFAVNTDLYCYLVNSDIVVLSALLLVLSCVVTWSRERLFLTPHVGLRRCRMGPALFPGRRSYEATKPGYSFLVFVLCCSIFVLLSC